MQKIFTYIRISTDRQAEKNTDENQEIAINRFLENKDVQIIAKFKDIAISGANANRKAFNEMKSRLNEVDAIAVFDIDRLSRDLEIGLELMRLLMAFNIKIYEARTYSIKDLTKDNDQLLYLIGTWYNAQERKKFLDRQKEGISRYRTKNHRWGRSKNWGKNMQGKRLDQKTFQEEYFKLIEKCISKRGIARILSMHIQTLYERLKECGIK